MKQFWRASRRLFYVTGLIILPVCLLGQGKDYRTPGEISDLIKRLASENPQNTRIHHIADSPGGKSVDLLEIGNEVNKNGKTLPAVLVLANLDGLRPLTSEGALFIINNLLDDPELTEKRSWYILPAGSPDAALRYFLPIKTMNSGNNLPVNDDLDENTDEDDFNDLNGDGYITLMRKIHPEGTMIPAGDEPRLMRKADPSEGETGIYKIYTEGIDDDGDGDYNEDGAGGTNVYLNFPHLFNHFDTKTGLYPGSAPEARGILEFAFAHPEIAMVVVLGETNFCMEAPKGGRTGEVDMTKIKIPERYARMFGADKDKNYSMEEIMEMVKTVVPAGVEVTESMIASFLGLGAVVNPLSEDLVFYNKFSKDYKKYLEEKGVRADRFDPENAKDGSVDLWAYYHLGVPVFSMDLWKVEKPAAPKESGSGLSLESVEIMSTEEFIALGEEKIGLFLKESGAPEQFKAGRIIQMMESGQADPKRMVGMMKQMPKPQKDEKGADPKEKALLAWSDQTMGGKGFVNWQKYNHPGLGEVEIGGFIPYLETTPPFYMADSLLNLQLPWIFRLADNLPDLKIYETRLSPKGSGIYQLEVWIENSAYLPFPTAMGKRNSQPAPAVITLEGKNIEFLQGYQRTAIKEVNGKSRVKSSWLIKTGGKQDLQIRLTSRSAGNDMKNIQIGG